MLDPDTNYGQQVIHGNSVQIWKNFDRLDLTGVQINCGDNLLWLAHSNQNLCFRYEFACKDFSLDLEVVIGSVTWRRERRTGR